MGECGITRQLVELRARNFQRHCACEFAPDDAAEAAANRSEISVGRGLNNQANAVSADVRKIARQCRLALSCRVSRKPGQQTENDGNEEERTTRHGPFKPFRFLRSKAP